MKILLQAIKSLLRKVENTAERVLNFFGKDEIIKQEHLPEGYPGTTIGVILPETTLVGEGDLFGLAIIFTPFTLTIGNEYIVTYNGKDYVCTAVAFPPDDLGFSGPCVGNVTGDPSANNEPFTIICLDNATPDESGNVVYGVAGFHDGSTSATISIRGITTKKMDVKYLPDGYPYGETAEILPRTTIDVDPDSGGAVIQTPFTLVPGNEYTVTFNGEDYTCIAQMVESEPGTFLVAIGNVGAIMEGSDTGEPFVVAHLASEVGSLLHQIMVLDGSTSVTISIVGDRIVKMDARYLPDEVATTTATDTVVTASMSAWSDNIITLSVTGLTATSKLEIGLSETATDEQYAAATAAQIRATGSGDGTVTLKAVAAPSVDLPILIRRFS